MKWWFRSNIVIFRVKARVSRFFGERGACCSETDVFFSLRLLIGFGSHAGHHKRVPKKQGIWTDLPLVIYTISQLNRPKTIKLHSPGAPRRSCLMSHLFLIKPACFWLVVVFLFVFGGHLRPWCIFVSDFFRHSIQWPKQWDNVNLHADRRRWWQQWCANGGGGSGVGNTATK